MVLIVFDMTDLDKTSLRAVADWRRQLLNHISDQEVLILLVGNKVHVMYYVTMLGENPTS